MISMFVAVIFYCSDGRCDFSYSQRMYNTEAQCMKVIELEMQEMFKKSPGITGRAACLEFKLNSV